MPGLACLNHLSAEVKSKSSLVCDCTTAAYALQRRTVHLGRAGYGAGAETCAGMAAGRHQCVCSWQQSDTWCFPRHSSRQGCFLLCLFRGSSVSAWCSSCCCCILLSSLRMPVAFTFFFLPRNYCLLCLFLTGTYIRATTVTGGQWEVRRCQLCRKPSVILYYRDVSSGITQIQITDPIC